jgi:hypothetical protein
LLSLTLRRAASYWRRLPEIPYPSSGIALRSD